MMIDLAELENVEANGAEVKIVGERSPIQSRSAKSTTQRSVLYFDLETVPDYDRIESFGLDPVPEPTPRATLPQCPPVGEILKGTLDNFKTAVSKLNPVDEYLDMVDSIERGAAKPRKGVFDITSDLRKQDQDREDAIAARRKLMSVTPEFNQIVAFGWDSGKFSDVGPESMVVGEIYPDEPNRPVTEREILEKFWQVAKSAKQVCGFNVLNFDLPTIFVRSMLLDIAPTRQFDMKPWGADVIDLMVKRFPKSSAMGLKKIAKAMGIEVPAGDIDGSQVEDMMKTDPTKVGLYVRSDVNVVKELHQRYSGFFC